jgi:hypothetical protein
MTEIQVAKKAWFKETDKQSTFAKAVFSGTYRFLLYGGAIRGGKTYLIVVVFIILCKVFPRSRWAIVRKDLPSLRRNVVPVIEKIRPRGFLGPLHRGEWTYTASNGSQIMLFPESIKDDPDLDRWKGLEVNGFGGEEANELHEKSFFKMQERAGSWVVPPDPDNPDAPVRQPPILILLTCNPAKGWIKQLFYDRWKLGLLKAPYFYLPAKVTDNPYLDPEYVAGLKHLPPAEYERFVEGNWDATEDPNQLIKTEWVINARNVEHVRGQNRLGVDVARYGDDPTVFAYANGNALIKCEQFQGISTTKVGRKAMRIAMSAEFPVNADEVRIDVVGLGAGAVDHCHDHDFWVTQVESGNAPLDYVQAPMWAPDFELDDGSLFSFKNRRSQMWWIFREMLRHGLISFPEDTPAKLIEDLLAIHYEIVKDKQIMVESKDKIKKRIGRSTDYGDAVVYAFTEAILRHEEWEFHKVIR